MSSNILAEILRKWLGGLAVCLFCGWLVKYHWNRRKLYKFSWSVPGPMSWPFIGSALQFAGSSQDGFANLQRMFKAFPTPSRIWLGDKVYALIAKPEDLEVILKSSKALEKSDIYQFLISAIGEALLIAPVKVWKHDRKIANLAFTHKILDSFVDIFSEQAKIFVKNMKGFVGAGNFDIYEQVADCNLDILCEALMGVKLRAQTTKSPLSDWISRGTNILMERVFCIWYHSDIIFNLHPLAKEFYKGVSEFNEYTNTIIKQRRKVLEDKSNAVEVTWNTDSILPKRKALLDLFLEYSDNGVGFTDEELLSHVKALLIAGSDTSASVISFTCMMLGSYPEIQELVYEEIMEMFAGDSVRPVEADDLNKLQYLERVIKETMRIFPVVPVLGRVITEDLQLRTCVLPRDTQVLLGVMDLHRNPEYWPEPLKFDPDRFLSEQVEKRHPFAYLPFSAGPRNCIGFQYAYMQMKTFLATFLRTYRIKCDYKIEDIKLQGDLMLKATEGYMVQVELRN